MGMLDEKYLNVLCNLGWRINGYTSDGYEVDIEGWTSYGQDLKASLSTENFPEAVMEYADEFDVDDQVLLYVDHLGERGVPGTVRELLEDMEEAKKMYEDLAQALNKAKNQSTDITIEEACRLIDPDTDIAALEEIEYYHGLNGKKVAGEKLREASRMLVDYVRSSSPEFWDQTGDLLPDVNAVDDNGDLRSEAVLVFTRNGKQLTAYYWEGFGWANVIDKNRIYPKGYVTHWRSLPAPPDGVSSDECGGEIS